MISADPGYDVLLVIILLAVWKRVDHTASGCGLWRMLALVIISLIYGVPVGAYFEVPLPTGSWLASRHIFHPHAG